MGHDRRRTRRAQRRRRVAEGEELARDARVAVNVVDPDEVFRYYAVRGRVIATTTEGARESIDEISQKYLGIPYPNFSGNPNETRVLVTIEADKITPPARD